MRTSSIFILGLATNALAFNPQQVLSALDLPGSSYQCDNGAKPAVVCNDASSDKHNCSCTCTNGIKFDQPLDPFSSAANGGSNPAVDDSECKAETQLCLEREQELMDRIAELTASEQKHVEREQELLDQLSICQKKTYTYRGCWSDSTRAALAEKQTVHEDMTKAVCESSCQGYKYYGLRFGKHCYCGNTLAAATTKVAEAKCDSVCPGDKQQKCGGLGHNSLYEMNE